MLVVNLLCYGYNSDRLIRDVEQHPDAFQHERAERFGCSQRGICEALKRLKIIGVTQLVKINYSYSTIN